MTTHSWGEQAPGEWTLKIQEASSQNRGSTELGPLSRAVVSQYHQVHVGVEHQLKMQAGPPERSLLSRLFLRGSTGTLKAWSLRFYGTAEWPYPENHRRPARSAEMPTDGDPAGEYGGESCTTLPPVQAQTAAKLCFAGEGVLFLCKYAHTACQHLRE